MSFVTPSGGGAAVEHSVRITGPATYNVSAIDQSMICDANLGAILINLPTSIGSDGRILTIKKIDSTTNTVTVDGFGLETIDSQFTYVINTQYDSISIEADSGDWFII